MQVTETLSEGLKREFKVVVPASELDARVNERLNEIKTRVQINGFRPGKVPVAHLKRVYGRSAMAEVIEATVRDANSQIVTDNKLKLAADPKVTLPTEQSAIEDILAGKTDLDYTVAIEIVPPITLADFKTIKLDKLTAEVSEAKSTKRSSALPSRTSRSRPKARAKKPRRAIASPSISPAASTAFRSRVAPAGTSWSISAPTHSFQASRINSSALASAKSAP